MKTWKRTRRQAMSELRKWRAHLTKYNVFQNILPLFNYYTPYPEERSHFSSLFVAGQIQRWISLQIHHGELVNHPVSSVTNN
jgi:hypothetical protein